MKTYIVDWDTNFGERVAIINATSTKSAAQIAKDHPKIWNNHNIELLDIVSHGVVELLGGDL